MKAEMEKPKERLEFTPRVLTGDRPTGKLHLGHYVGTLSERLKLQEQYPTTVLIADLQVFTDHLQHYRKIEGNVREVMLDYLGVGLNPEKCTFFIQSQIPELSELAYYFNLLVTVSRNQRNPTLKSEQEMYGVDQMSVGMFVYPISQAADILFCKATLIPVGQDQLPHIEITREIARKFNRMFRPIFPIPEAIVGEVPTLVGIDGKQKMSKSLDNAIFLSDTRKEVETKVMRMFTDPKRIRSTDPGDPDPKKNPVFLYHHVFNPKKDEVEEISELYKRGGIGDVEVKRRLATVLNEMLDPIRDRRKFYEERPGLVNSILQAGIKITRKTAQETLEEVREAMGIAYKNFFK